MSVGLYTITTRAVGTVLTASIYNADHQNHVTNQNPSETGAYSDTVNQMQIVNDPGDVGSENIASSLAGELASLRAMFSRVFGLSQWYAKPGVGNAGLVPIVKNDGSGFALGAMVLSGGAALASANTFTATPQKITVAAPNFILNDTSSVQSNIRFQDNAADKVLFGRNVASDMLYIYDVPNAQFRVRFTRAGGVQVGNPASGDIGVGGLAVQKALNVEGQAYTPEVAVAGSSGSFAIDLSTGNNFTLSITGNITLANPVNAKIGQSGYIVIAENNSGLTITWGSAWRPLSGTAGQLLGNNGSRDYIFYQVDGRGLPVYSFAKGVS